MRPPNELEPLTSLVEDKTAGNPFFAIQFLTSLQDDGLICLDPDALAWRCNVEGARAKGYTDNVVDLMVAKLRRLPAEAQEAATIAACVGNVAGAGTLAMLRQRSVEETHRDLWELVREGMLLRSGDTYRFSHDRVQQAAYLLIPEDQRSRTHLTIGRLLLAHTPAEQLSEKVFDIVNQLNRGASLIEDQEERYRLAELDLLAGQRAGASTAFGSAVQILAAGMAMLPAGAWEERHALTFALHLERARSECLTGRFAEAERHTSLALLHSRTFREKAACYRVRVEMNTVSGEVEKGIDSVLECAALFGHELERHPSRDTVEAHYAKVMRALGDRRIEALIDLPAMSDPEVRALAEVLAIAVPTAHQYDMALDFAICSEAVWLSIVHGNAPCSVTTYCAFGNLIGPMVSHYGEGYRFAQLAHALVERDGLVAYRACDRMCVGYMTSFWTHHVGVGLPLLEEGIRTGAPTGSLTLYCYCAIFLVSVLLARGDALDEVERQSERVLALCRNTKYGDTEDMVLTQRRLVRCLRGDNSFAGARQEDEGLDSRIQGRSPHALCWYYVRRLQERFLYGDYQEAFSAASRANDLIWTSNCFWEWCEHSYFFALTLAALCAEASAEGRDLCLRTLRAEVERYRVWAGNCPENFQNRYALISAEVARIEGRELDAERLYEEAIRSARENGFVQNEALAYELASKFYRTRGFGSFADTYLREARACYARWGADRKVKQLEQRHPQLIERRPPAPNATFAVRAEQLDLRSAAKASQSISSELLFEKLLSTLLRVVLEQGGADRACLILARGDGLSVEAEAVAGEGEVTTRLLPSLPLATASESLPALQHEAPAGAPPAPASPPIPSSLVQYARWAREPVILRDAAIELGKFSADPFFARHRPRSVLCLPILRQADLLGLLYLENNFVAGAFTPDGLTALTLLASQAAISMENVRLLDQERAARAKEQARAAAEEAIRLHDEFLSTASHELRTPLASLLLVVQSLERGVHEGRPSVRPEMLTVAARQTQRLTTLVSQLLDVSRIQSGRLTLRTEEVDLVADTQQLLERMQTQIQQTGSFVRLRAPQTIVGRWDRSRLEQVLTNLLSNALSYGAGKPIDLTIEQRGSGEAGSVRITMRDQGIGIAPDRLPHIFERFERATSTRHYGGLGLGLYIARQIVQAHGGTITAVSELGRGSTFTVDLPLRTKVIEP